MSIYTYRNHFIQQPKDLTFLDGIEKNFLTLGFSGRLYLRPNFRPENRRNSGKILNVFSSMNELLLNYLHRRLPKMAIYDNYCSGD